MSTLSSESNREIVSYSLSNIAADVEFDGSSIKYRYHLVPDESGDYIFEPFAPGSKSIVNSSPSI
ncbi:Protein of unknown function [Pyronema omphalodes CBS 100304]|uniref:Uncharacterized protein n=1 Tax=Pyronema omphalodes (strain CBS 100304) TaxID=1076935 RepID=U4LCD9_PYROM|nr:Protein of unknown function [Pyronema omphalodes CBS 100304]